MPNNSGIYFTFKSVLKMEYVAGPFWERLSFRFILSNFRFILDTFGGFLSRLLVYFKVNVHLDICEPSLAVLAQLFGRLIEIIKQYSSNILLSYMALKKDFY